MQLGRTVWMAGLGLALCAPAFAQSTTAKETRDELSMVIKSKLSMKLGADAIKLDTTTRLDYTNTRKSSTVGVSIRKMAVKVTVNGQPNMNTELSGSVIRVQNPAGQWIEITEENADANQKAMMADGFDKTLAEITVDAEGKETKRTLTGGPGASTLLDNGAVENARFFHPRFSADKTWSSKRKISVGNNRFAEGELSYEKVDDAEAAAKGLVKVKVSGTLKNGGFVQGPTEMKNLVYAVTGTQLYNSKTKTWVSGELAIKISWDILGPQGQDGKATGTMSLSLGADK